jgi:hypothetical protein
VRSVCVMVAALLAGCASTQLKYNSVDVATSVSDIYQQQVLDNFSRIIDEPYAVPAQAVIATGQVQTQNTLSATVTSPLSRTVTRSATSAITGFTTAGAGLSGVGSDAWQQNWTMAPVNDATSLKVLRALYRHVIYGDTGGLPKSQASLPADWLYWSGTDAYGRQHLPPPGSNIVNLGFYRNHDLFMLKEDWNAGNLSNFVLLTMPNGVSSKGAVKTGVKSAPQFLVVPQSIIPVPTPF